MAYKQEVNIPLIVTIGIVSAILLIVVILGMEAWFKSEEQAQFEIEAAANPNQTLERLRDDQLSNINAYHWVNRDKGLVTIPIADAMKQIVAANGKLPATQP